MTCKYCGWMDMFYWKDDIPYCANCNNPVPDFTPEARKIWQEHEDARPFKPKNVVWILAVFTLYAGALYILGRMK